LLRRYRTAQGDVEENGFYSLFFASSYDEPICNDGLRERVQAIFGESHQIRTEKRASRKSMAMSPKPTSVLGELYLAHPRDWWSLTSGKLLLARRLRCSWCLDYRAAPLFSNPAS
jgi:hypothetical protein